MISIWNVFDFHAARAGGACWTFRHSRPGTMMPPGVSIRLGVAALTVPFAPSIAFSAVSQRDVLPGSGRRAVDKSRLAFLAGCAMTAIWVALASPAQAQFVCVDSGGTTQGAFAAGSGNNFACGASAYAYGNVSGGQAPKNTAIGTFADAHGDASINTAIGDEAKAQGDLSHNTASGAFANASGDFGFNTATGYNANASGSSGKNIAAGALADANGTGGGNIAIGYHTDAFGANVNNTAVGAYATATGAYSAAFGAGAKAEYANSTAIGPGTIVTRKNQVAVGAGTNTYTLAGLPSAASNAAQVGPTNFVTTDQSGNLGTSSFNPADIGALDGRVTGLEAAVADNKAEARGGTALALASAGLRYDDRPGKVSIAGGIGHFKGMTGLAAGIGFATSDSFRLNAAISGVPQRGDVGVSAGLSWTLN